MIPQLLAAALILSGADNSFVSQEINYDISAQETYSDADCIDLYVLSSKYDDYLSIPETLKQSYQLDSDAKYRVVSGKSVTVNSSGLIKPRSQIWYWKDGFGATWPIEGADEVIDYFCGETVISVTADGYESEIHVNVIDYSDYYVDKVMDEYISENILPDMTTEEKIEMIAKFAASYDYNASHFNAKDMIITQEGGDCWATTDASITMAKKLGFDAWVRKGNKDPGAGSGHIDAVITDGVKYYEVDAGFTGKAPRYYVIMKRESLFSYITKSIDGITGAEVYQYDGPDTDSIEIPSKIEDYDVISIANSFMLSNEKVVNITLPSTLIRIGDWAFSGSDNISEITLPESVKNIGQGAFNIANLKNINGNSKFVYENGLLYDIENDEVVSIPNAESVIIPEKCRSIGQGAAYNNSNLRSISIGGNVSEIKQGAFYNCSSLESVFIGDSVKSVGTYAFCRCSELKKIIAENDECTIGDDALYSFSGTIYASKDSSFYQYAIENNFTVTDETVYSDVAGDVNNDEKLTAADLLMLRKYLLKSGELINSDAADVTQDGIINILDMCVLKNMVLSNPV